MGGLESLLASVKTSQNKTRCISDLGRESDPSAFSFIIVHRTGGSCVNIETLIAINNCRFKPHYVISTKIAYKPQPVVNML